MDYFSLFSCDYLFPITVPNELFKLYHSIDRKLFVKLIHDLRRGANQSMEVVGFLIWLENSCYSHNTVMKVLDWPLPLVNQLCNEIIACLKCVEKEEFTCSEHSDLFMLQKLCSRNITIYNFYENRNKVIACVSKIVNEVCMRAFEDILNPKFDAGREFVGHEFANGGVGGSLIYPPPPPPHHHHFRIASFYPCAGGVDSHMRLWGNLNFQTLRPNVNYGNLRDGLDIDLSEIFGGMNLLDGCEDETEVPPEDRTIFLTFSKGYYIAECKIRDFFTRIFGDFIEQIHMQEVMADEQPLFALMVARSSAIIGRIAPGHSKARFSINGKHVFARKYVKKDRATISQAQGISEVKKLKT